MNEFCPKCGSTKGPFIKGFCEKCYLEDHELISLPEIIEIEKCARCGKIRIFGKWVNETKEGLAEFFERKVKVRELATTELKIHLEQKSVNEFNVSIMASGLISGQEIEAEKNVLLKFKNVSCPFCGKLSAGYFEAKIQVRWNAERDLKKEKEIYFELKRALKEQRSLDSLAVITKREILSSGVDIYIGSNKAARSALSRVKKKFKAKIVSSKKLAGRTSDGRNRFKFTYSLRL